MAEPGPSRAPSQARFSAPTASSTLKNASRARATASPSKKVRSHRVPASPSKRAVTRATSSKFDIRLHSPIKTVKKAPGAESDASSKRRDAVTEQSQRGASSSNIFSRACFSPPRAASSDIFGSHNLLVRGSGLGLSPERSPERRTDWTQADSTASSSSKRSSIVCEDQHDLSFDIASPHKRTAKSIFARSPGPGVGDGDGASSSTRLVDPTPVGVSNKRRRDAFDLFGQDETAPFEASRSPVRKRVAFTQPESVSPKLSHLRSPPSPERMKASPSKGPTAGASPTACPVAGPSVTLFPDLSMPSSSSLSARPGLARSHSLPADIGLAAPLPIRSSNPFEPSSFLSALDSIPESPALPEREHVPAPAPVSPIRRPTPPKRTRSLTDFTLEALAEDAQSQRRPSPARFSDTQSPPVPDLAFTSATPPSIRMDDFLADSVELRAPQPPPQLVFGGALPFLQDSAFSSRPLNDFDQSFTLQQAQSDLSVPVVPQYSPLSTLMEEDDVAVSFDKAASESGIPSTSAPSSAECSFSTEGMSADQIAKLSRIQSMVSRLKPCRRLSTPVPPPPAPYSSAQPASRLRSGNNTVDAHHSALEARPKPASVRRGSLLEQASLSSASQMLTQRQSPPVSPSASPEGQVLDLPAPLPLADIVAFVDVRTTEGDDASSVFVDMLKSLGARVLSRHTTIVTHIVYKGGRAATLERVRNSRQKPHVVGIGWVVKSKETMSRAPEDDYRVDLGRPTQQQKNRRKSFEPRAFTSGKTSGLAQAPRLPALGEKSSNVVRGQNSNGGLEQAKKASNLFKPKVGSPLAKRLGTPEITE